MIVAIDITITITITDTITVVGHGSLRRTHPISLRLCPAVHLYTYAVRRCRWKRREQGLRSFGRFIPLHGSVQRE